MAIRVLNRRHAARSLQPHPREPSFGPTLSTTHYLFLHRSADKGRNWPMAALGFFSCEDGATSATEPAAWALSIHLSLLWLRSLLPRTHDLHLQLQLLLCSTTSARLQTRFSHASPAASLARPPLPKRDGGPGFGADAAQIWPLSPEWLFFCSGRVGVEGSWRGARGGPEPDDIFGGAGPRLPGWL